MTGASTTLDLVDQAATRARLAALLGRLLAGEPGPDLAPLVAAVDSSARWLCTTSEWAGAVTYSSNGMVSPR